MTAHQLEELAVLNLAGLVLVNEFEHMIQLIGSQVSDAMHLEHALELCEVEHIISRLIGLHELRADSLDTSAAVTQSLANSHETVNLLDVLRHRHLRRYLRRSRVRHLTRHIIIEATALVEHLLSNDGSRCNGHRRLEAIQLLQLVEFG